MGMPRQRENGPQTPVAILSCTSCVVANLHWTPADHPRSACDRIPAGSRLDFSQMPPVLWLESVATLVEATLPIMAAIRPEYDRDWISPGSLSESGRFVARIGRDASGRSAADSGRDLVGFWPRSSRNPVAIRFRLDRDWIAARIVPEPLGFRFPIGCIF
ncbi:hypothetical protein ZIOFF_001014 [Zingiber officinale]|uniref:Uncharacterized protein n=1 Tax=Zingiber officinale TaxID=94328 RepID=A0A8J5LRS0_ZINOF|nr:hypothetical protein ZIOFF_001014 [Zingiber officinale]